MKSSASPLRRFATLEALEPRHLMTGGMGPFRSAVVTSSPASHYITPTAVAAPGSSASAASPAAAAATATGYTARIKTRAYSGTATRVELLPTPLGNVFPAGAVVRLTSSDGSAATVITPDADGGAEYAFTPSRAGSFNLTFTNTAGLANPAAVAMTIHPGVSYTGHIAAPRTGNTQFTHPGNEYLNGLINAKRRSRNIFIPGETVQFLIPGQWSYGFTVPVKVNGYEVRNFDGGVVDSGSVAHSSAQHTLLTLNVSQPGWYRLYLYDSTRNQAVSGDAVGEALFSIWESDANLANPGMASSNNVADFPPGVPPQTLAQPLNSTFTAGGDPVYVQRSGTLTAPSTGTWLFEAPFGVSARLTVNGVTLFDQWHSNYSTTTPASIVLTAGQAVNFSYEAYLAPGVVMPQLYWRRLDSSFVLIPTAAQKDESGAAGVITARYQTGYHSAVAENDQYLRALTGNAMGLQRIGVVAGKTFADFRPEIRIFKELQRNRDANRPKLRLGISFPDYGTARSNTLAEVTTFIQSLLSFGLTADDFVVECTNEPNLSMSASTFATSVLPGFFNAVKGVNPGIRVIGPATVALQPADLGWIQQFIDAGGAAYLDAFSFHHYNGTQGDFATARKSLGGLKQLLASNGMSNLELYQTEQGDFTAMYGLFAARHGIRWTMTRALIYEQEGLPMERNHYWYDRSSGFWDFPMFQNNSYGGLMPPATAFRVMGRELYGKVHSTKYTFGGSRDNIYAGSLFAGPDGSVAMFMTAGDAAGRLTLNVAGASSVTVVSWEGKTSTIAVANGKAVLPVTDLPVYVRVANGTTISVANEDPGVNLARAAVASASKGEADAGQINDGDFENWYHGFGERPWTSTADMTLEDAWVELRWATPQNVDRVNVFCPPMWQGDASMLDYEVQYHNGTSWVTVSSVVEPLAVVPAYQQGSRSTVDDYSRNRNIFQHTFNEVRTDRIRVLCHIATYGGASVKTVFEAGGQAWNPPRFMIRELEAYNDPGDKTWIGPAGGDWSVASNWSPTGVPSAGDRAILGNGRVKLDSTLKVGGLSVGTSGWLDLNGHKLVIDYSGSTPMETWTGTGYSGASGLIKRGALRTSQPPSAILQLGAVEAADALGLGATQTAVWSGLTVDRSSVLVRFSYGGDANLDGRITIDDYGLVDAAVAQVPPLHGYVRGDFNLDGKINIDDYGIIDLVVQLQGPPLP